jgi:very-short-patch-repair endonuclease
MRYKRKMTKHFNKKKETEKRRLLRKQQTFTEKILWTHLRKRQALGYKFRRQYSVDHFVIDFYCPELKLALELDGDVHEVPAQKDYDKARQKYLEAFGIKFVRIKNVEFLGNPNKAFLKIEKAIKDLSKKLN